MRNYNIRNLFIKTLILSCKNAKSTVITPILTHQENPEISISPFELPPAMQTFKSPPLLSKL